MTDHVDKIVKQAILRSAVSSGRLQCTKTELFNDDGRSDDTESFYICAKSYLPSRYFSIQTSNAFQAESSRLP